MSNYKNSVLTSMGVSNTAIEALAKAKQASGKNKVSQGLSKFVVPSPFHGRRRKATRKNRKSRKNRRANNRNTRRN